MRRRYSLSDRGGGPAHFGSARIMLLGLLFISISDRPLFAAALAGPSDEERLQRFGYATQTDEDIHAVLRDDIYAIRQMGLRILAQRQGQQAIGTLKAFLNDEKLPVRVTAASLLGQLGDSSGLPVMRQEYVLLIGSEEEQRDPAALKKLPSISVGGGLRVGKVLAELGDYRGYQLAVCAFEHQDAKVQAFRLSAIDVLGEIVKGDPEQVARERIDIRSAYDSRPPSAYLRPDLSGTRSIAEPETDSPKDVRVLY